MPQKIKDQFYVGDSSDLQELMSHVAGWAQSWNDVWWYLKTVAPHDKALSGWDVSALEGYIDHLQREGARFTTDYRQIFEELAGHECQDRSPIDSAKFQKLPLRTIADKWLVGLLFPASRQEVIERAKANHAPSEILKAMKDLEKERYLNVGVLLHELGQKARA